MPEIPTVEEQLRIYRRLWPADWREKSGVYTANVGSHFLLRSRMLSSGEWCVSVHLETKTGQNEIMAVWDRSLGTILEQVREYLGALSVDLTVGLPEKGRSRGVSLLDDVVSALREHLGDWVESEEIGATYAWLAHGQFYVHANAEDRRVRLGLHHTLGADAALGDAFVLNVNEVPAALTKIFDSAPPRPSGM
jgi:hypothetical protein